MAVKVTATRQLSGTYGEKKPGDVFEVSEQDAEILESRGNVVRGEHEFNDEVFQQSADAKAEADAKAANPEANKMVNPTMNKERVMTPATPKKTTNQK